MEGSWGRRHLQRVVFLVFFYRSFWDGNLFPPAQKGLFFWDFFLHILSHCFFLFFFLGVAGFWFLFLFLSIPRFNS